MVKVDDSQDKTGNDLYYTGDTKTGLWILKPEVPGTPVRAHLQLTQGDYDKDSLVQRYTEICEFLSKNQSELNDFRRSLSRILRTIATDLDSVQFGECTEQLMDNLSDMWTQIDTRDGEPVDVLETEDDEDGETGE